MACNTYDAENVWVVMNNDDKQLARMMKIMIGVFIVFLLVVIINLLSWR